MFTHIPDGVQNNDTEYSHVTLLVLLECFFKIATMMAELCNTLLFFVTHYGLLLASQVDLHCGIKQQKLFVFPGIVIKFSINFRSLDMKVSVFT